MMKRIFCGAALLVLAGTFSTLQAQEEVFQRGIEFGIGGRALGMGGAYLGVSDDYSAAYWNPAALTQIRRIEGFATLSHAQRKDDITYGTYGAPDKASFTRFNSLGLAYPIPTYRGSLVFSLGYHRVRPYDSNFSFSWFNGTPLDSLSQRWSELEEGSLNNWTFAMGTEVAPNLSLGLALNAWSGQNDYQFSFVEKDVLDLFYLNEFRHDDNLLSEYSGWNFKLAAMYHPSSLLRLGVTLGTPTTFKVKDSWQVSEETIEELDNGELDRTTYNDNGEFTYKIRSPFSLSAGGAVNFANMLVSGSAELNDWSQIRYTTEPPIEGLSKSEANDELVRNYRETLRLRLGAEFTIPLIDLQVRAGAFRDPSPLANMPSDADREFYTAGLGIFLDKQVRLDLAVVTGTWREYKDPLKDFGTNEDYDNDGKIDDDRDVIPVSEKIRLNQAYVTLAFRF
ncbi:outer membrane protein transport protein [candidate division KSB1 bacterium]|nr:outer membrane protein transport protein [candidate division KSB1 bacterium]